MLKTTNGHIRDLLLNPSNENMGDAARFVARIQLEAEGINPDLLIDTAQAIGEDPTIYAILEDGRWVKIDIKRPPNLKENLIAMRHDRSVK